jgi:hypothetical protein
VIENFLGKNRLVGDDGANGGGGNQIGLSQNPKHPGMGQSRGRIDLNQLGMGMG